MKTLKNNYTTPEQSKRLLGMGVPAWTADMYYSRKTSPLPLVREEGIRLYNYNIPCWSVGRLMEIAAICFDIEFIQFYDTNFIQQMMNKFEMYAENMDFSKLEE